MMNRWSNKYSQDRGGSGRMPVRLVGGKVMTSLLAAMLVVLVLLGIFGGRAIIYRSRSEQTFVNRMLTECDDAISATGALSRSGGSESAAILGKIRASIHAVDAINEVANTVKGGGGYYVSPVMFTELYGIIDAYSNNLKLGNVTIENLNNLVNSLEVLRGQLAELK